MPFELSTVVKLMKKRDHQFEKPMFEQLYLHPLSHKGIRRRPVAENFSTADENESLNHAQGKSEDLQLNGPNTTQSNKEYNINNHNNDSEQNRFPAALHQTFQAAALEEDGREEGGKRFGILMS